MLALLVQLLLFFPMIFSRPAWSAGGAPPMYRDCPNTPGGTYAPNSTYASNLAALAAALIKNATAYGSGAGSAGGAAPDAVYGVALCRGDSRGPLCAERLTAAFADAMNASDSPVCELRRNVTLYYDRHQLRFADADFLSGYGNAPEWVENNTNAVNGSVAAAFRGRVAALLGAVADAAAASRAAAGRYAAGEAWFEEMGKPVYGLAQCTRDMAGERCRACLRGVTTEMATRLNTSLIGARVIGARCVVRYEMDPFFEIDNMTLHLDMPNATAPPALERPATNKNKVWTWVVVALVCAAVCVSCFVLVKELKKRRKRERARSELRRLSMAVQNVITLWRLEEGNSGFSLYDFSEIKAATNNFSDDDKLGQGGFGSVYKGELPNGLEIAAKRLAASSGQGLLEFKNEIQLVAKLQHRNLVKLLGCCIQGDQEKILVYEYLPNKSLDTFIFDEVKRHVLSWPKRLHIIDGICHGLLYLHEHSTVCVVHRDLKASNILLDSDMNAKISDFGIARIFCSNATQSNTTRVVGTIGYIAPEYALDGVCSIKSDVFSFGVLVLEIISGKKTGGSYRLFDDGKPYCLIAYAWQLWRDGRWHELVDSACLGGGDGQNCATLRRCTQVALLCVQEDAEDRPTMDGVVRMLSNDDMSLPEPKHSAYFNVRPGGGAGAVDDAPPSSGNITITMITLPR